MNYRLREIDDAGRPLGSKDIDCLTDREAIAAAENWFGLLARFEVWNETRPVCLCSNPYRVPSNAPEWVNPSARQDPQAGLRPC